MNYLRVIKRKINTFLSTKRIIWRKIEHTHFYNVLPDKWAIQLLYHNRFGRSVNFENPQTFSEKLQWLKLYNHDPLYTRLVDKYAVKQWVSEKIGDEYIIPTLGIWNSFAEIDFDKLPNRFVLKTTHSGGSSGVVICKDKSTFDYEDAKKRLTESLSIDTYIISREWPYKDVPHRILAEQYVDPNPETNDLSDYKFFCFDGKVKALFVGTERQKEGEDVKFDFFDADFNHLPFRQGHDHAKQLPEKPKHFELMKKMAEELSLGIPHVRIDFYDTGSQVLFGEMTFYHFSGLMPFEPQDWDYKFGEWLTLPCRK